MDKINKIFSLCKNSVSIVCNTHKDYYESIEKYLTDNEDWESVEDSIRDEMIKRDTMIYIQAYNKTPIGSYTVYHYDINAAIDEMLDILESED